VPYRVLCNSERTQEGISLDIVEGMFLIPKKEFFSRGEESSSVIRFSSAKNRRAHGHSAPGRTGRTLTVRPSLSCLRLVLSLKIFKHYIIPLSDHSSYVIDFNVDGKKEGRLASLYTKNLGGGGGEGGGGGGTDITTWD